MAQDLSSNLYNGLTEDDLFAIAGHILVQPKIVGEKWGGGANVRGYDKRRFDTERDALIGSNPTNHEGDEMEQQQNADADQYADEDGGDVDETDYTNDRDDDNGSDAEDY